MQRKSARIDSELQLQHSLLLPAFEYWLEQAEIRGALPARADLDPKILADLLPEVQLIEAVPDPKRQTRLRYRIIAGLQIEILGRDVTDELIGLGWADDEAAGEAIATGSVVHVLRRFQSANGGVGPETLILPLSSDGRLIDSLLVVAAPAQRAEPAMEAWPGQRTVMGW